MGFIFNYAPLVDDHSEPAHPITLDEVVLQALTPSAYSFASERPDDFSNWISSEGPIRQGHILAASSSARVSDGVNGESTIEDEPATYLVRMTEPVEQGCVIKGATRISVVSPEHAVDGPVDVEDISEDGMKNPNTSEESLEIDESFLSNAMLSPAAQGSATSAEAWHCTLVPSPMRVDESDCAVYVSSRDLSRLGALDGDWALIGLCAQRDQRLVRVHSEESHDVVPGYVYAAPALIYNIAQAVPKTSSMDVFLRPTPFGASHPPVPVARAITVARVSSPISTDRAYQTSFLHSLHQYFLDQRRLVKQGDIIALPLNTDDVRRSWMSEESEEGSQDTNNTEVADLQNAMDSPNEAVYFKITNVEYDVLSNATVDEFYGSSLGEWGCWVDHSQTRIVQTGVEQSRVPYAQDSAELGHSAAQSYAKSGPLKKLRTLLAATLTQGASDYRLQLSVLLQGVRGIGKMSTIRAVAQQLGLHILEVNCYRLIGENDVQTEGTLRVRFEKAAACAPCILVLRHIDALSQSTQTSEAAKAPIFADVITECMETLQQSWNLSGYPTMVVATTDYPDQTSPRLLACFKHQISFDAPDESERDAVLHTLFSRTSLAPDVSLRELAIQTAALVPSDLADLVTRGERVYLSRAASASGYDARSLYRAGVSLSAKDLEVALSKARTSYAESIGAPKIPNVTWDDVGGLASVKADILDTIQLPLEHPELFSNGMKKRSGILLYGPPGTGKTLLAKAVATSCALNFFSVKGPELLNMYIGESEANVRKVFQRARDAKPCVIFFDELDSVAPKRGNHGDSGGVMDRIVSQLLAELDGIAGGDAGADVFVIGATNRPDLLDPALLRPGRFDRMLYLGVSQTHEAQLNILQALTRKFKLHPDLSLQKVAESCPFHYTGADFYALCSDALLKAMSRKAEELDEKIAALNAGPVDSKHPYPLTPQYYLAEMASPEDIEVLVTQEDFESALRSLIPSVSQAEMEHYARVQQQFSKETINSAA